MSYGRRCKTRRSIRVLALYGVCCALAVLLLCASPALGATLNVPGDYATIQGAIAAAVDGDEVVVQQGTYYEWINFLGKAITVTGTNPDDDAVVAASIIDGQQLDSVVTFNSGEAPDSVLTGFTIQNGQAYRGGGILCWGSSPTIEKNRITDNQAAKGAGNAGGGIFCGGSSSPDISQNDISLNTAQRGGGIWCRGALSTPSIAGNTISHNTALNSGGGIGSRYGASPTITDNDITSNSAGMWGGGGIHFWDGCESTISGNTITDNSTAGWGAGGVFVQDTGEAGVRLVVIEDNVIRGNYNTGSEEDAHGGGIQCSGPGASVTITGNIITENVSGRNGGGILLVGIATFEIRGNTIARNVAAQGGGGILGSSYGPATIAENIVTDNSATFIGGISASTYPGDALGPITIEGNDITGNFAADRAAGVTCGGEGLTVNLTGNEIRGNVSDGWAGGIWCGRGSTVAISNNTISENSARYHDAGVTCRGASQVSITDNTIQSNLGIGVTVGAGTGVTIRGNSIGLNDGLGIDLGDLVIPQWEGPTPNDPGDADTGPNNLQNFPELIVASSTDSSTTIVGVLDSTADTTFALEFFANSAPDPSGYGEGETLVGSTTVTTDAAGFADFTVTFPVGGATLITATATDADGNTSEFSAVCPVASEAVVDLVAEVQELDLQQGIDNSLDAKLDSALNALDDINEHNNVAAIKSLQAFINAVSAQSGHKIPEADAQALIAYAQAIIDALSGS